MAVTRIQPSATYTQDEIRRIQDSLAQAIDVLQRQVADLQKKLRIPNAP